MIRKRRISNINVDLESWWDSLEEQWQKAFSQTIFRQKNIVSNPTLRDLTTIWTGTAIRFAGPLAPFPNMNFELTNLSGLSRLRHLEIVVVIHHKLRDLDALKWHRHLRSLFVHDNQIEDISGTKELKELEEFYFQNNSVQSLLPIKKLHKLKTVYCHQNQLTSLEGLTESHSDNMQNFFCLPNSHIKTKEIIKTEKTLYIQCKKV